jgi:hypothetical protein
VHHTWSNGGKFKVKLSHSTGEQYPEKCKTSVGGLLGITGCIAAFYSNEEIRGYIEQILIAPYVNENAEAKIVCFNGMAVSANKRKRGAEGGSAFPKQPMHEKLTSFAEQVISKIKSNCDHAIVDQVLRVDFYCDRSTDSYYVNSVSGFDAEAEGVGIGTNYLTVANNCEAWWIIKVDKLLKKHLERSGHPAYQWICEDDANGVVRFKEEIFKVSIFIFI